MRHWDAAVVLAWACCGALMISVSLRAQDHPVWVELSCRVAPDPGSIKGSSLLVEIQTPQGETSCQALSRAGAVVRFKGLRPGIYLACLSDKSGRRRCQSVDLYPSQGVRAARFSVELKPPLPTPQAKWLYLVGKADLAVPERARREFDEFLKDRGRSDVAEALRHLERALEIHPEYPEAMINLGFACHLAGDYARAVQLFERVTQIAPEMPAGWLNLGVTLLVTGDPLGALQAEVRALNLCPDDPFVVYQVALCHYRLREFDAARRFLNRVIELDPCSAAYPHVPLARIALAENRPDEAVRLVQEVSRLHPHAPQPPALKELMSQLAGVLGQ